MYKPQTVHIQKNERQLNKPTTHSRQPGRRQIDSVQFVWIYPSKDPHTVTGPTSNQTKPDQIDPLFKPTRHLVRTIGEFDEIKIHLTLTITILIRLVDLTLPSTGGSSEGNTDGDIRVREIGAIMTKIILNKAQLAVGDTSSSRGEGIFTDLGGIARDAVDEGSGPGCSLGVFDEDVVSVCVGAGDFDGTGYTRTAVSAFRAALG